jgi:glycosyltransferase involved in cell wall biosynthesis
MKIIILHQHPIYDDRIIRHLKFLVSNNNTVSQIHINRDNPTLVEGVFSQYGEKGFRINVKQIKIKFFDSLYFNIFFCYTPLIYLRAKPFINNQENDQFSSVIIHVHDAVLLRLAIMIKKYKYPTAKIVYDRHELFEYKIKKYGILIPKISRLYEILTSKKIDGVVSVSKKHNPAVHKLFPRAIITTVPNFPIISVYDQEIISHKIKSFKDTSEINLVYIGSLDNQYDRDITFLLKIVDHIMDQFRRVKCIIGGANNDSGLRDELKKLEEKYPGRFEYLGQISRESTIKNIEKAHFGFFLLKPTTNYWVKCSPNKVFEYLICGVIPIIRADIDYAEDISSSALIFDRDSSESAIINTIKKIILDSEKCIQMMNNANEIGKKFSFDEMGKNYIELYNNL